MDQVQRRQGKKHRQRIEIQLVRFVSQYLIRRRDTTAELDKSKDNSFLSGLSASSSFGLGDSVAYNDENEDKEYHYNERPNPSIAVFQCPSPNIIRHLPIERSDKDNKYKNEEELDPNPSHVDFSTEVRVFGVMLVGHQGTTSCLNHERDNICRDKAFGEPLGRYPQSLLLRVEEVNESSDNHVSKGIYPCTVLENAKSQFFICIWWHLQRGASKNKSVDSVT